MCPILGWSPCKDEKELDADENNRDILQIVKDFQAKQFDFSVIVPNALFDNLKVDPYNSVEGDRRNEFKIAPGQGKVPVNIMSEIKFDVGFFTYTKIENFDFNSDKKFKCNPRIYLNHKLLNPDKKFCNDPSYYFMGSHFFERHHLEQKLNVSGQKGEKGKDDNCAQLS